MVRSVVLVVLALASASCAQEGRSADWRAAEAPLLTDHVQLTHRDQFVKAGEAYFNADASWIIFQAVPVGQDPSSPYSMYLARVVRDADKQITGLEQPILISPPDSANTCGWFHPKQPGAVLFGSTLIKPSNDANPGFQVGGRRYQWLFPEEMDIVLAIVPELFADIAGKPARGPASTARVFELPRYQAECSYSKDGRFILYATVRPKAAAAAPPPPPVGNPDAAQPAQERPDPDIWIYDTKTGRHTALVTADGYDGGPFFSPDEKWICYRSDRNQDDLLQLYVAELKYEDGAPAGIAREIQVTNNGAVNWAPYWHPSGKYLVFGTSLVGHHNYEIFAAEVDPARSPSEVRTRRVTNANGADVLPVFSPDGTYLMWTGQRGPMIDGEQKPSSQLWVARTTDGLRPENVFSTPGK